MDGHVGFVVAGGWCRPAAATPVRRESAVVVAARGGQGSRRSSRGGRGGGGGERRRPNRVGELFRRELSEIVREDVAAAPAWTGLVGAVVSVLEVDVSPDLRNATVRISVFQAPKRTGDALSWLKNRRKTIRLLLSQRVREMRNVPELRFIESDVGAAFRTVEIINSLNVKDEPASSDVPSDESSFVVEADDDDPIFIPADEDLPKK